MTLQLIVNIFFSVVFLAWMAGSIWFLYRIWQSNTELITVMRDTILDNARTNVETVNELTRIIERHHEPPHDLE